MPKTFNMLLSNRGCGASAVARCIAAAVLLLCFNSAWADCEQELVKLNTAYPDIRPVPSDMRWLWETKHTAMKLNERNETTLCHELIVDMQKHLAKMKALSNLRSSFHYDQDARKAVTGIEHLFRAKDIIGSPVINTGNETLGIIEAVTFEAESGRIHYVVMDAGSVLDPEPRPVAIPWNKLSWIQSDQVFVVDTSRRSLQHAPAIGTTDWPGSVDASWIDGAYDVADDRQRPAD